MLLEYVKNVQPESMERFVKQAPNQVQISSVVWPARLILCKIFSKMYEFTHAENASTNTQVHL
jgi:hypothetical protein